MLAFARGACSRSYVFLTAFVMSAALVAGIAPGARAAAPGPIISDVVAGVDLAGNPQLTIKGVGFGAALPTVQIGSVVSPLAVSSNNDTQVVAALPTGTLPGSYLLTLTTAGNGGKADEFWFALGATGRIVGKVLCGRSLVYVPGRSIMAYTNAAGDFQLDNLPNGTYEIVIETLGQSPANRSASIDTAGAVVAVADVDIVGTNTDVANCGSCGNACAVGDRCESGECVPPPPSACSPATCPTGANAIPVCNGDACGLICNAGYDNCNGAAQDGCEVNIAADPINCGACGNVCGSGQCNAGHCTCTADSDCPAGYCSSSGTCAEKKPSGASCTANIECSNGTCYDNPGHANDHTCN